MGLLWDTPEERARKERELQRQSLLGTPDQAAQIGQLGRFSMPLTPAKRRHRLSRLRYGWCCSK